ncbi:MAG: hypothetical protein E7621_06110 [Ruminococcaceae bacterium]|nr:hypothetical protein [Oscillospiraceae bacterium]
MKKRLLSIFLALTFVLGMMSCPITFAEETNVVYASSSGEISGISSDKVRTTIEAALVKLGKSQGTIYISGDATLPAVFGNDTAENGTVTIKGLNGTSDRVVFGSENTNFKRDVVFENITIKPYAQDERWISARGCTITIEDSCKTVLSDTYSNTQSGLYIGMDTAFTGDSHYVIKDSDATITMIAPVANYGGQYTVNGNVQFDLYAGTYKDLFGIVRNGLRGTYQTLNGDVTYNIFGGNYNKIHTGSTYGGNINGNVVFNFYGGNFSSDIKLGDYNQYSNDGTKIGNTALIFDAAQLKENGSNISSVSVTQQDDFGSMDKGTTAIIFNHIENDGYLPEVTATSFDYWISVYQGKATPVYAESSSGNTGALLGFDIVSDDPLLAPCEVAGDFFTKNEHGYYDLPQSSDVLLIEFLNPYEGMKFTATFKDGAKKAADNIVADGNTYYTLPLCTVTKKDNYFSGWSDGENIYATGEKVLATANVNYTALFTPTSQKQAVYVCSTGDDTNTGFSEYAPLKTFEKAAQVAYDNNLSKIVLQSAIETTKGFSMPQYGYRLTITGEGRGGSLKNTDSLVLNSDVTFEHMGLASTQYKFIATNCHDVVFGEGLEPINGKGIELHAGYEAKTSTDINCTIKSGQFDKVYFGGAYFTQTCVGVSGNITLNLENTDGFNLNLGFDGYTGNDAHASIGGSVIVNLKNSSLSSVTTERVTEIGGSLLIITDEKSSYPPEEELPDVNGGKYFISASDKVTVLPAADENGDTIRGAVNVTCEKSDAMVQVVTGGKTYYYGQGNITLPGKEVAIGQTSFSFEIPSPIVGHKAEKRLITTDGYFATIVWLGRNGEAEEFKAGQNYTAKISLEFYNEVVSDNISFVVNGQSYNAVKDGDTYSVSIAFPRTGTQNAIYVKSDGLDTNAGKAGSPTTMAKALEKLRNTGGVIFVLDKIDVSGTLGSCNYPILISGEKSSSAELNIPSSNAVILGSDTTFENIKITMGLYSHINDDGHKLTLDDSVIIDDGKILHFGTYGLNDIEESYGFVGRQSTFELVSMGGAYNTYDGRFIEKDLALEISGIVREMRFSLDSYESWHKGALLKGNVLITMNDGSKIDAFGINPQAPLTLSENSAVHFILNGNASIPEMSEDIVPSNKLYTVKTTGAGKVLHALDENGKSVAGTFDIIPDEGYAALIQIGDESRYFPASRHTFQPGKTVNVMFVEYENPNTECVIYTDGGKLYGGIFELDGNNDIIFTNAPEKKGYIFEGWYADSAFTKVIENGSSADTQKAFYAKYIPVSFDTAKEEFVVKGAQIRLPSDEKEQGLRYIIALDKDVISKIAAISDKNSSLTQGVNDDVSYGACVLPALYLGNSRLENNSEYIYEGNTYYSKGIPAKKLFGTTDDKIYYTVCITGIASERYDNKYMVAPYLTYYTRSGNKVTVYGDVYGTAVIPVAFEMLDQGKETADTNTYLRENIMPLYAQNRGIEVISPNDLKAINDNTQSYKDAVLESENISLSDITGTVYYVSNNGNDKNDGKKNIFGTIKPWKTISKVNSADLKPGDAVLFERGGEFRGKITAKEGVTYSAYGTGDKPIINGSERDYADSALWLETSFENVYKYNGTIGGDVGLIAFDHSRTPGDYDELYSSKRISGVEYDGKVFTEQSDLSGDLEFYHDKTTNYLYLYSKDGNPGDRFYHIEIATTGNLVNVTVPDVTVDNLHFRYGGAHGVGGSGSDAVFDENGSFSGMTGCSNLKVTNCIFAWIGGSILDGTTRFGNAVEIYGSCDGYTVENNWIYQIYDTGITHQLSSERCEDSMMQNINYSDNLVEYCHWSIEFYNQPCCGNHKRIVRNVLVSGNILRMGGYGWGSTLRQSSATLYNSFGLSNVAEETQNFKTNNNIFFRCTGPIYRFYSNASERNLTFDGNTHIQDYEAPFSWYCGKDYYYSDKDLYIGEGLQIDDANAVSHFYAP